MGYNNYQYEGATSSVVCDNSDVIALLNQSMEADKKCCADMTKFMYGISYQLNQQGLILRELLKCCHYRPYRPHHIPGQAIIDITPVGSGSYTPPTPAPKPIDIVKPKPIIKTNYKMYKYPADRGYFTVLGIPNNYNVVGRRIVDKLGEDLCGYLPIYFNENICNTRYYRNRASNTVNYNECYELVGIMGYVVKNVAGGSSVPYLIYETKNLYTGAVKTFEGTVTLWDKYAINR
jgi:hypothetical protein